MRLWEMTILTKNCSVGKGRIPSLTTHYAILDMKTKANVKTLKPDAMRQDSSNKKRVVSSGIVWASLKNKRCGPSVQLIKI